MIEGVGELNPRLSPLDVGVRLVGAPREIFHSKREDLG